ncbi:MAG: hypothetical protein L6Q98_18845 [Anaerolineae bacterium]|nr:hypothetical protein [Anaerolineae bacterium]NUQ03590.1 hypothetical protein [Anaerolineae bacterium]
MNDDNELTLPPEIPEDDAAASTGDSSEPEAPPEVLSGSSSEAAARTDALRTALPPERTSHGRARARQAQRRRQHQMASAIATRAQLTRKLRPLGQFRLPSIRLSINRAVVGVIGAALFTALLVFVLGRLRNETEQTHANALWIGPEWTYEAHTDADIQAFAQQLRAREIGLIYAWVSWLQPNETWSGEAEFGDVQTFVMQFRAAYPDARLYGWVSLPVEDDEEGSRLSRPAIQEQVAAFSQRIVSEFGFDGVFVNVDPVSGVRDGDQDFLSLLRAVRAAVGLDTPVSAALPPDWSPSNAAIALPPLIAPNTEWQTAYKQSVALLVDQMAVMTYQSGYASADEYSAWVAYQVKAYASAVAELSTPVEILIGVPTYPAASPGHDPAVENIASAVQGIRAGLDQAGTAARYITGVAIYAGWETDEEEWSAYQRAWVD